MNPKAFILNKSGLNNLLRSLCWPFNPLNFDSSVTEHCLEDETQNHKPEVFAIVSLLHVQE